MGDKHSFPYSLSGPLWNHTVTDKKGVSVAMCGGSLCSDMFPIVECSDNLFTQRTGVITSPDFPNPYPKSSECFYAIRLEEGFMISLQFEDIFDIEDHPEVSCPYDYIKVSLQWTFPLAMLKNLAELGKLIILPSTYSQDRRPNSCLLKNNYLK